MALFRTLRIVFWLSAVLALIAVSGAGPRLVPGMPANSDRRANAAPTPWLQSIGRIPLSFEANQGQTDPQVRYLARGPGYTVFLTATEAVLALNRAGQVGDSARVPLPFRSKKRTADSIISPPGKWAVLRMELLGSNPGAVAQGAERLPGIANYFLGNDPSQWRTGIPTYAQVYYPEVYPGIGLVYYGNQRQLEYDFQVSPGADPSQIRLRFSGADRLTLDERGDLIVQAKGQILLQHKPVVYQDVAGERHAVAGTFWLEGNQVGFSLGDYDRSKALIIDPVLSYSTYLGGSPNAFPGDGGVGIAVDSAGCAYVTGYTTSPDFPTANPFQPALGNPYYDGNAFITKLTADGSGLIYSTYLGGSGNAANGGSGDRGVGIAVDAAGSAYVTGFTTSSDFPTVNAFQPILGGSGATNAFVAKLTPDGSALVYSTYLGGSSFDDGFDIAVDQSGHVYVTGETNSNDFPTVNAFQPTYGGSGTYGSGDAFVTSLDAAGQPVYSTYLGGSGDEQGHGIAVDTAGNAYVTGVTVSPDFPTLNALQGTRPAIGLQTSAFVARLDAAGQPVYSTYLGGSGGSDSGGGIAVDAVGNAYVTGTTGSHFPTVNPLQATLKGPHNAFVAELSADGSALLYSTYLGGRGGDYSGDFGQKIAVDQFGQIFVTGITGSPDFPTLNAIQPKLGGSGKALQNAFVTSLSPGGGLLYSTYLGGSYVDLGLGIAVDQNDGVYVSGVTYSEDFPAVNAFQPAYGGHGNAFVAKISP
ncbi:MAG TPA: SBBP repeat-containing protein [Gemmataceae bacterium]|nr:SBBP repeat-containing protein [Gemmataceae bacterium]